MHEDKVFFAVIFGGREVWLYFEIGFILVQMLMPDPTSLTLVFLLIVPLRSNQIYQPDYFTGFFKLTQFQTTGR